MQRFNPHCRPVSDPTAQALGTLQIHQPHGTACGMQNPTLIHLQNAHLDVTLRATGAALIGLRFTDTTQNLVLGFKDPAHHDSVPIYAGALVGPIANRLEGGAVTLNGQTHQMPLNENGQTTLHSGPDGLHAQNWQVSQTDDHAATFTCTLPDGACGLPGTRNIAAQYTLHDQTLTLQITATTDAPTPMNIAAHPYWNLDGQGDVHSHTLYLNTNRFLPTGPDNLPLGPVARAPAGFDFTTARAVPRDPALDVNYCLPLKGALHPAATLTGANGTQLHLSTDAPGLQVYNGAHLPNLPRALTGNGDLQPYGAIALEPQHWPNAPHNRDFPDIALHPGTRYSQITQYRLTRG